MDDLIKKLTEAECGSRELDALVDREITYPNWRDTVGKQEVPVGSAGSVRPSIPSDYLRTASCPHYTTSLDAALTLVPEGWAFRLTRTTGGECEATVHDAGNRGVPCRYEEQISSNLPMALCIAALRARQVSDQEPEKAAS